MSALISSIRYFFTHWMIRNSIIIILLTVFIQDFLNAAEMSRKVLVLYDSKTEQSVTANIVFENFQTILNYYGIMPEYGDVNIRPLPDDKPMSAYRGIITIFDYADIKDLNEFLMWVNQQFEAGRKVIILGNPDVSSNEIDDPIQEELIKKVFLNLGLEFRGNFTANQSNIQYVFKDKEGVEFEREYPKYPVSYLELKPTNKDVKCYLSLLRADKKDSISSVIVTSPSGGLALSGFIYWEDPITYRRQWYLNPFRFLEESLDLKGLPAPDPTTLNGLRVAFSHIDGDAFSGATEVKRFKTCGEIIIDKILKKYDFPVTVSVVVGEVDPGALGNKNLVKLAKSMFALPNVEPASHSYSHPFYWDPEYEEKNQYEKHHIDIPKYSFDPEMEIDYSVNYISKKLSPKDKPCKIFLWSGNCEPLESHIARCDSMDIFNMNGGDTVFDDVEDSYISVAPLYRWVENRVQFHCGQANENILTNLWTKPIFGFKGIITTMERTGSPRRIKPIDIYYHFYCGQYRASLKALQDVYEWVLKQDIARVFTSDYLKMAKGYLSTKIYKEGQGRYIIKDYGECLTFRFDLDSRSPDLSLCENVLGFIKEPQGLYVSLMPGKKRAVIVMSNEIDLTNLHSKRPYLRKASGWVNSFDMEKGLLILDYKGFGTGRIEIGGMESKTSFKINGTAIKKDGLSLESDERGILSINNIRTGNLEILLK
ncbi:MAG: polysaccharide deacetylase [Candidatus Scalinduaceae bacterium]